eukprot:1136444-Pelagomonas_calceolata.AAC.2
MKVLALNIRAYAIGIRNWPPPYTFNLTRAPRRTQDVAIINDSEVYGASRVCTRTRATPAVINDGGHSIPLVAWMHLKDQYLCAQCLANCLANIFTLMAIQGLIHAHCHPGPDFRSLPSRA